MLSFSNLDAANRAHAARIGSGIRKPERFWPWFFVSLGAAVLFGAGVAWLVLPRGVFDW